MGCITRLGCLFVLLIVAIGAWLTRDRWLTRLEQRASHAPRAAAVATERWEPLSDAAADTTRGALKRLGEPRGQVFESVSPAALASYVYQQVAKRMPTVADSVEAMANGDKLSLRAVVSVSDLGGAIGDAVGIVHDRERVELTGTLSVLKPGTAVFDVSDARIHGLPIPKGMIATLIDRIQPVRQPGVSPNALPLPIPRYIGDIRVASSKITLYKTVQ
ncbi:MAG TPA: hypothetical protein VGQ44_11330 [Gemmatimonadaceae bacterium]|jgi:hypothetical protein|nr:hypothetical protein [Gemmatimonadaceae bacterium]